MAGNSHLFLLRMSEAPYIDEKGESWYIDIKYRQKYLAKAAFANG